MSYLFNIQDGSYLLRCCWMSVGETLCSDCEVKRRQKLEEIWKVMEGSRCSAFKGHRGAKMKCLDFCCQNAPNVTLSNHLASKTYEPVNLRVPRWGRGGALAASAYLCVSCQQLGRDGRLTRRRLNKYTATSTFPMVIKCWKGLSRHVLNASRCLKRCVTSDLPKVQAKQPGCPLLVGRSVSRRSYHHCSQRWHQ